MLTWCSYNSSSFLSFLFKPCILIPDILNMCTFYFVQFLYSSSYFCMLNLEFFTPTTRGTWTFFTSATLMDDCFVQYVCSTASIPFYTNLAFIQFSSKFLGMCVCGGGGSHLIYIVSPNISIYNQYFCGAGPEQSLVLFFINSCLVVE